MTATEVQVQTKREPYSYLRRYLLGGPAQRMVMAGLIILIALISLTILAPVLTPYSPSGSKPSGDFFHPLQPPNPDHLMGTNDIGQDVFARLLYGGRVPLLIAFISTIFAMAIGIPLGLASGYRGGIPDRIASLLMDSLFAFPGLILAIAITVAIGPSLLNTAVAIMVIFTPVTFRTVRSQVFTVKEMMYVEAAKSIGENTLSILFRYIFPNVVPGIVVIASLSFASAILVEAGLAFVGLSTVVPPAASWGVDLVVGQHNLLSGAWWIITFPGLMIMLAAVGFSLIGEGLNDLWNPKFGRSG